MPPISRSLARLSQPAQACRPLNHKGEQKVSFSIGNRLAQSHRLTSRPLTQRSSYSQQQSTRAEKPPGSDSELPPISFNWTDLGANRTVKITILIAVGIIGTTETIFYTRALWRYFVPPESSGPSEGSE